jgi:hypothetical protein
MTISRTILTRGYFPKEMPPGFFTEPFAHFAATARGRSTIIAYKPADNFTECVKYRIARSGSDQRDLRIPNPGSFAKLTFLTAKHFSRLLKKVGRSKFARSRPRYVANRDRAIEPLFKPANLARERMAIRAGASFILKADISQFYPSLYTHAVGWAVDPKLRNRKNWNNLNFLGRKLDQALMDVDGKSSQGIPIGNDISFLLAEVVLAQVDRATRFLKNRSYRWFDDFEIAFDSRVEAENGLKVLRRELDKFRLRLNPAKTRIEALPQPSQEDWREILYQTAKVKFDNPHDMVKYFDTAFRLREKFPDSSVLSYTLGVLFKLNCPKSYDVGRIAQSCITQALISEPGVAQKAFALLSFWRLNGFSLDENLIKDTICKMILQHQSTGPSSDIAWALAFCLEEKISLTTKAGQVLSGFDDDSIVIESLDMKARGLLPHGFSLQRVSKILKDADLDRDHWLLIYESVRRGFLPDCVAAVKNNPLFSQLLATRVTFYRTRLPEYALVIHPGGAPEWVVKKWLQKPGPPDLTKLPPPTEPVVKLIEDDLDTITRGPKGRNLSSDQEITVSNLLNLYEEEDETEELPGDDEYSL